MVVGRPTCWVLSGWLNERPESRGGGRHWTNTRGLSPRPPGGEDGGQGDYGGVLAPNPEPRRTLVPIPTPGHPSCRSQRDPIFKKAFRVTSRPPGGPGGPRQSPGPKQDALWGSRTSAPRDLDCACGQRSLESAPNGP